MGTHTNQLSADNTSWEAALALAEEYWFQLPVETRRQYTGYVVALLHDHILDVDTNLNALRKRLLSVYGDQPVLYLDADANREPALLVRSPRWG